MYVCMYIYTYVYVVGVFVYIHEKNSTNSDVIQTYNNQTEIMGKFLKLVLNIGYFETPLGTD